MSVRTIRMAVAAYLVVFLLATTWPGVTLINKVTPLMLGLPFNLFSMAVLILIALCLLAALYFSEKRNRTK